MTQRNISRLFSLLGLSIAFLATPLIARAATYYVAITGSDSNPGTSAAPWRTIQRSANVAVAGDTVLLLNGTYVESQIGMYNSGSSGKPITFQAQNQWGAVLSSTSGCNPAISVYASYITIKNIEITRDPSNVACKVYTSANVGIRAWNVNNPTVGGNTSSTYTNFTADGVKIDNNVQFDIGIKTNQDYTIIQNCVLYKDLEGFDIEAPIFSHNTMYGYANVDYDPIILIKGGARDGQIYSNIIYAITDGQAAIDIGGGSQAYGPNCCWWDNAAHIEVYNTVAYDNVIIDQTSDAHGTALVLGGASNSGFSNNVTIGWVQLGIQTGSESGYPPNPATNNPTFANNIFFGNGHPATGGYFGWAGAYTGQLTVDHNDFYNYSSALPTQTNAITGKPLFVNPASDWHLQSGSPAIGAGVALSKRSYSGGTIDVSHDFNGVQRIVPWDLGIYVMGAGSPPPPPPSLPDLIVTSLSYNSTTGIFTSVVLNQGTAPTPTGIVIGNGFYVDGTQVTWGSVPGPLAPGASVTIDSTGGGAYTISPGTHTIMVKANDYGCCGRFPESNENNNTLSETITIGGTALPDLIVASLSYNSTTGIFTSVVLNQGTAPTPSGIVIGNGFYVDGTLVTWGAVPGPLAPGASVTIDSSGGGPFTISPGTHTIMVKANDYGCCGRFPESNENNNTLSQTITIAGHLT